MLFTDNKRRISAFNDPCMIGTAVWIFPCCCNKNSFVAFLIQRCQHKISCYSLPNSARYRLLNQATIIRQCAWHCINFGESLLLGPHAVVFWSYSEQAGLIKKEEIASFWKLLREDKMWESRVQITEISWGKGPCYAADPPERRNRRRDGTSQTSEPNPDKLMQSVAELQGMSAASALPCCVTSQKPINKETRSSSLSLSIEFC